MVIIQALRLTQAGLGEDGEEVTMYVTAMTLSQLREHAVADTWSPSNPDGYQRPLEPRRLREVAKYVREQQGILPTSLLLGTRPEDDPKIIVEESGSNGSSESNLVHVQIPDGAKLWLIDGQHRFCGVNDEFDRTGDERLAGYKFPVSVMWEVTQFAEMTHFNLVNTRQKKMSTDIVDRHLVKFQEKLGLKMVSQGAKGEKEYSRATATRIVDKLNEQSGPWYHQIAIPGVAGRDQGLVRQHAFVTSLDPYLKDSWVRARTDDDKVQILVNFWEAASKVWPDAFESPKNYRVQATVGIYSLHMALPVVIQRCLDAKDLTPAAFESVLAATSITSQFWHKEDGDPLTLGTGMSSIRALAQNIIQLLPQTSASTVRI